MQFIRNKTIIQSFKNAWLGLTSTWLGERNMRVHWVVGYAMLSVAYILQIPAIEMAVLVIIIALVIAVEGINTAMEHVVNMVTDHRHPLARAAKDATAGSVLVMTLAAVFIGLIMVFPRFLDIWNNGVLEWILVEFGWSKLIGIVTGGLVLLFVSFVTPYRRS